MINSEIRRLGIGGSEVGAILGCDETRDGFSIWTEKKGDLPAMTPNDRMIIGKALEPGVLQLYTHVTGNEVQYCDVTSQHPDRPWMVYTPDALCINERRGVDAKVVNWDQRSKWGDTADEIPMRIQLQCWWYMAALDYDVWDVAALFGYGLPHIYTIERDREAERVMLARVEEFYRRYLIGCEVPPIGGSQAATNWVKQAFPHHKVPDMRAATAEEIGIMMRAAVIRAEQKKLKHEKNELDNQIRLAIAEREGLHWFGGKCTWRRTKDTTVVDWKSMALGLLNGYVKDPEVRLTLERLYTSPKEGTRRLLLTCDAMDSISSDEDEAAA